MKQYPPLKLTPEDYELQVKMILDGLGMGLTGYQSQHRELIAGTDGEYEIDVTVRFTALGANFLTLIECKHYKRPVEREKAQALLSKMRSVGAQKGMIFSTSGFQSGAIDFAAVHGMALIELIDGRSTWIRKAFGADDLLPWSEVPNYIPRIAGWLFERTSRLLVTPDQPEKLIAFLRAPPPA